MSDQIKFEIIRKIAETNFKYGKFSSSEKRNFLTFASHLQRSFKYKNLKSISKFESISPPSIFIGSVGHQGSPYDNPSFSALKSDFQNCLRGKSHNVSITRPFVNVGILSPLEKQENAWIYEDTKYWAENNFGINEVLKLRNTLLNSRFQSQVQNFKANKKFIEIVQEIAIASKPVDVEIELKNKLRSGNKHDKILIPHGMNAELKQARVTENVKVHNKVDKVINDEIKASEGIEYLYKNNFNESTISKILSAGVLGLKKNKKLVPTRWSITSTDDILGKQIINQIKDCKWIEDYELFFGEFMGNCYLITFFPSEFNYELFEVYIPGSSWNPSHEIKAATDFENYFGRKNYASNTAGGYYAVRLGVLEYLNKIKRQASIFVLRIETPGYWASLGVWVCREACRKALKNKLMKFDNKEEMINSAKIISEKKFNFDCSEIFEKSKLLQSLKTQTNLYKWI